MTSCWFSCGCVIPGSHESSWPLPKARPFLTTDTTIAAQAMIVSYFQSMWCLYLVFVVIADIFIFSLNYNVNYNAPPLVIQQNSLTQWEGKKETCSSLLFYISQFKDSISLVCSCWGTSTMPAKQHCNNCHLQLSKTSVCHPILFLCWNRT